MSDSSGSVYNVSDEQSLCDSDSQPNVTNSSSPSDGNARKRKRRLSSATNPFKRRAGVANVDYLDLLNHDIDDTANKVCLEYDFNLPQSQVGLIFWSPLEKQLFFEALARLGRHDLPGIASSVGTKSVIEVRHYLHYLKEANTLRNQRRGDSFLEIAEYPAAVELSQQCCHALEQAADTISLKQETEEIKRETKKWGDCWNVTPEVAEKLAVDVESSNNHAPGFARLFDVPRWLQLSKQVLMNSSVPGDNWHSIGQDPPSIWATALDDFYSLAVSHTRRLVQMTLFISMSRIKAERLSQPEIRDVVHRWDAETAVKSLGLALDSRHFWLRCARRLRLRVCRHMSTRDDSVEEDMTYDDLEAELARGPEVVWEGHQSDEDETGTQSTIQTDKSSTPKDDVDPTTYDELEAELVGEQPDEDATGTQATMQIDESSTPADHEEPSDTSFEDEPSFSDQEQEEIAREADEVLWYTATNLRDEERSRRPLERRIAAERRQEEQAQEWDEYASYQAELSMWNILRRTPPLDMPKAQEPGRLKRCKLNVESMYSRVDDWASQLKFRHEWEMEEHRHN
ncbi:hypothetical protein CP533_0058 [Ophiocordyceps camponoti-saundersi (nom. inval.)]|nr:hypothetical protein CP533_0058 [Ophiocordyceps camponoti-saundersi (nom. inval.)]